MASELGFDISHLYLRPVPFEAANQRSVFVTAALEDGSSVDRHVELSVVARNVFINIKILNQVKFYILDL